MLEELFKYQRVLTRHLNSPFREEREKYLKHRAKEGSSSETLVGIARELFHIAEEFKDHSLCPGSISSKTIRKAAEQWGQRQYSSGRAKTLKWPRDLFFLRAKQWFEFLGCLCEPAEERTWYADLLVDFSVYMEQERGLSSRTIKTRCWHVDTFLRWLNPNDHSLCSINAIDIDRFLTTLGKKNWSRVSVASSAKELRAFFKYAAMRHLCDSAITEAIEGPRLFKQENIPSGPSANDVKRLLASMQTDIPRNVRDRVIVMFFAVYGLRSGEVSNLQLDDIDWTNRRITFRRGKQRCSQIYPLVSTIENALIEYLQSVRQKSSHREIFLTLKAPIKPLSAGAMYHITSTRFEKLGISTTVGRGPHSLRHASAIHLVSEGFTLKEIGDHLGHKSASATRVYAKVDLPHLREVATFNFGGAL